MEATRLVGAGSIALTGVALLGGSAASYFDVGSPGVAALALLGLGGVVGVALIAAGWVLYQSDVQTSHTLRVAGWNLLGVTVLGAVVGVASLATDAVVPGYVVVDVVGVSSVAHVLIGYNDVQRIRASELAEERRKLAVVSRLARHNIRNETQILTSYAGQLVDMLDDPATEQIARNVQDTADELSGLHDRLQEFQRAVDEAEPAEAVDVRSVVEDVVDEYRETYPDGTFDVEIEPGLTVVADDQLRIAIDHLVENAVTHGSPVEPHVRVEARDVKGLVTITVRDFGPGIPPAEIEALQGDEPETQMEHASGLGLWVVTAIVEQYGGDLTLENDENGGIATLSFEAP